MNLRPFPFRRIRRGARVHSEGGVPSKAARLDRCDTRLAEADPWAYDRIMSELIVGAAYPGDTSRRELVLGFLAALPDAIVRDRCPCGDHGCHTYTFIERRFRGADVQSLQLQCPPGWEAFSIDHSANGTILGVEIFVD